MPKTQNVTQKSRAYKTGSAESLLYIPADTVSTTDSLFLISSGFGATPEDYQAFGHAIAERGGTALIPNCNEPAPGNTANDPLVYRADVIKYAAEDAMNHFSNLRNVVLIGHSMGDASQAMVVDSPPDNSPLRALVSLSGAGWEKISARRHSKQLLGELGEAAIALPGVALNIIKNPRSLRERLNLSHRARELMALWGMEEGRNLPYYELARKAGAVCLAYTGPKDKVISASETTRIAGSFFGPEGIVSIHPNAGHFGPQTHPKHVAKLIMSRLTTYVELDIAA